MKKIKKSIYLALNKVPLLQKTIRKFYIHIVYMLNYNGTQCKFSSELYTFGNDLDNTFFGYFDKYPGNKIGKDYYCIFHSTNSSTRKKPTNKTPIDIVLFNLTRNEVVSKHTSRAYNWQQGSRLHWLNSDKYIYNDFDENINKYFSKVVSVSCNKTENYPLPVQDSYKDLFYLALSYEKLNYFRPDYGYRNIIWKPGSSLNYDGIWKVSFEDKNSYQIISIESLVTKIKLKENISNMAYINHIAISPNGERFVFLLRFIENGKRKDVLFSSDLDGSFEIIVNNSFKHVSHYSWFDDSSLLVYMTGETGYKGYHVVNIYDKLIYKYEDEVLQSFGDGHPSVDGIFFTTDTYPNKSRRQNLILSNVEKRKSINIAEIFSPISFDEESRCDLHPRFSLEEKLVFFDYVVKGRRKLAKYSIEKFIKELR